MEERKLMIIIIIMTYVILSQWVMISRHKQKISRLRQENDALWAKNIRIGERLREYEIKKYITSIIKDRAIYVWIYK